jgi:membrane protein YqaA with SNARE-associated domain
MAPDRPGYAARMESLLTPDGSLISVFVAAFLAATLLPLSSELALFVLLKLHPDLFWAAIAVATMGNAAGGMTNYAIGRLVAGRRPAELPPQVARLRRWGAPATALGWLPFIGEALCLAAGYLKLNWVSVAIWQIAGRGLRYWVVAQTAAI